MLRLKLLGGLSLEAHGRALDAVQKKALVLLAVIAAGTNGGISRDKLLAYFWPESDEERARNALRQRLFALRRDVHDDLLIGTTELRLNPDVITSDVSEFEAALAAGELQRAVDAYGGPFLDGVYLDDAPAFEQWVEAERGRLAQSHIRALESLASAADAAGDVIGALTWWRRLAAADPLGGRPAMGFMRALAAAGDSAAALRHARVYEATLRAQLDVAVEPAIVEFTRRLRERPQSAAPTGRALENAAESNAESSAPASRAGMLRDLAHRRPRALLALAASSVLVLGAAGVASIGSVAADAGVDAARLDPNRVAVVPFRVRGDSAGYLREGMVHLLSAALDSAGSLSAVDTRALLLRAGRAGESVSDPKSAARIAAAFGAGLFVVGDVTEVGGRVQVTAALYSAADPGKPIVRSSASDRREATFDVVDRVAAALLAGRPSAPHERLARVAAISTSSLPALKAYLAGERKMRSGRHGDAIDDFQAAISLDSTFALAYYRLSIAADWASQLPIAVPAAESAARYADRLSPRDRALVHALLAWRRNDIEEAERRYKLILTSYPDDVETWYQLGEVYFHNNPPRGRSFVEARRPFERALALEPDNKDAPVHLMRIAAWEQQWDTVAALLRRIDPKEQDVTFAAYGALARRDEAAVDRAVAALGTWDAHGIVVAAERVAVYTRRMDVAARTASLLANVPRAPEERALGFRALASLAAAGGRWREARAHVDSLRSVSPHFGLETQARLATVPFATSSPRELAALRDTLLQWRGIPARAVLGPQFGTGRYAAMEYPARLTAAAGMIAARLGDTAAVRAAASALSTDRTPGPEAWRRWRRDRSAMLRAELLRAAGRPTEAIAAMMPMHAPDDWGSRDEERLLLAEMLSQAGRFSEAVRWLGSFEHIHTESLPWAAPAHFMRAELLERLGRREEAAIDYERVVELWRDCDSELRPMLEEAQSRSARLRRLRG